MKVFEVNFPESKPMKKKVKKIEVLLSSSIKKRPEKLVPTISKK